MSKIKYLLNIAHILLFALLVSYSWGQGADNIRDEANDDKGNTYIFIDAKKNLILGKLKKAEKLFKKCLEIDPNDDAAMYELSGLYLKQNKTELAISYAKQAMEADPDNIWYMDRLAGIYKQKNQFSEASEILEMMAEKNPDNIQYLYELALTSLFSRDYDKAIECYNIIEEKIGISEEISIQKQKIYLLQNDSKNAIKEIEALTDAFPTESKYYSMLAELYLSNKDEKKALKAYEKVLKIDPDDPYIDISLSDYYRKKKDKRKAYEYLLKGFAKEQLDIETKINIILAYYTIEEIYDAKKDQAFQLAEILVETHPNDHRSHTILADFLYQDKQYKKAKKSLQKVLSIDSSRYTVWEQLLFVETELQDFEAMNNESKRALALFPNQPLPYLFAAISYFQLNKYKEALNKLERGVKFVIDNELLKAQFYSYIGDAEHELDNDEKAFEAYKKALKINPENTVVLNNYAYYLSLQNRDLEEAREMARKAVEIDSGNPSNQDTYGWVLYKLGLYEEAEKWIKKSLNNHKEDNPVILEHYGDVLYKLGKNKEALKYWKRARKAGEGSELLDKKVEDGTLYE